MYVKASDLNHGLSLQALTAALGPFEAPGQQASTEPAWARYTKTSRSGPLCETFQHKRAAAPAAREAASGALRERHTAHSEQLWAHHHHRQRPKRLTGLRGILRRDSFPHLAEQRRRDHAKRKARQVEERRELRGWQGA